MARRWVGVAAPAQLYLVMLYLVIIEVRVMAHWRTGRLAGLRPARFGHDGESCRAGTPGALALAQSGKGCRPGELRAMAASPLKIAGSREARW